MRLSTPCPAPSAQDRIDAFSAKAVLGRPFGDRNASIIKSLANTRQSSGVVGHMLEVPCGFIQYRPMRTKRQYFRKFGDFIRTERARLKMTQAEFAAIGHVSKATQVAYEANETQPQADYLALLAEAGADAMWILTGRGAPAEVKWEMLFEIRNLVEEWAEEQRKPPTQEQKDSLVRSLYNQFCATGTIRPQEVQATFRIAG